MLRCAVHKWNEFSKLSYHPWVYFLLCFLGVFSRVFHSAAFVCRNTASPCQQLFLRTAHAVSASDPAHFDPMSTATQERMSKLHLHLSKTRWKNSLEYCADRHTLINKSPVSHTELYTNQKITIYNAFNQVDAYVKLLKNLADKNQGKVIKTNFCFHFHQPLPSQTFAVLPSCLHPTAIEWNHNATHESNK